MYTKDVDYKGQVHRAGRDDPQYAIKSAKTDHIAPFVIAGRWDEAAFALECGAEERLCRHRLNTPLNVASFNSLRDFCHQPGTRPQRIGSKTRLRGNHISRVLPDICGFVIELGTPLVYGGRARSPPECLTGLECPRGRKTQG